MKAGFEAAAAQRQQSAARYLHELSVEHELRAGGRIFVHGDLDLSCNRAIQKAAALPDLGCVEVGGDFYCAGNMLSSLKGAPFAVGGTIRCTENDFVLLDGMPQHFEKIISDLGTFHGWDGVPDHLKPAIEADKQDATAAAQQRTQDRAEAIARAMTITADAVPAPVRFKTGGKEIGGKEAGSRGIGL